MRWLVLVALLVTAGCGTPAASEPTAPHRVTLRGLTVESVPADSGFWATTARGDRLWVRLDLPRGAAMPVQPGERLDVTGTVVPHGPGFPAREGVTARRDAELLARQGTHLEAGQADVRVVRARQEPERLSL
jgi:hypothetical protein